MKKVLFVATVDSHILAFHIPYIKYFKSLGYEVHVMTNGDAKIPYVDKKYKVPFKKNPFSINNIKALFKTKKILNSEKYDMIHTHTPVASALLRLASIKTRKINNTKVFYTAHGFHFYKGAPLKNWLIFYPIEKFLAKYTDTLICINKEDYILAKEKFKKCKNIYLVNGVGLDEEKFKKKLTIKEKDALKKELGLKNKDFVIVYSAEINDNKNQLWLIDILKELFEKYEDMHLLLPGDGKLYNVVKEKVKDINNVHLLGFRKDIPNILKISDLAISSSKREGLPLNIIEAIYENIPLVVTNVRGNRDLVQNNINGYVVSLNNPNLFKRRVEKLYKDETLRKKLKEKDKDIIKEYLLDNILENMKEIYKSGGVI